MKYPYEVIQALEATNSRLEKEAIIQQQVQDKNTELFEGFRLALDPLITFGLKQIPEKTENSGAGLDWETFTLVLTGFVNRQITGNAARDQVLQLMAAATRDQWNYWLRRILIKDLRCGVSEKTVNKVVKKHPEYAIDIFSCQLAHDSNNHESKVAGKKQLQDKLDGVRLLTIVYPSGRVDMFSRNGKEMLNFTHIADQFSQVASALAEPMVFDGEVMSSSFQELMKQVHRKENVNAGDAVLYLFDMIPLDDFRKGVYRVSQTHRTQSLNNWFDATADTLSNVRVLDHVVVDLDTVEGRAEYMRINQRAIDAGFEGLMLKDINAPYECKRSHAWLKLKPFIEVTLEVVAVEEGTGRNVNKLGALVCSGVEDNKHIVVNVGSGFTDADRAEFWEDKSLVVGQLVEVRADAITQNQDGTYSLRFPRFLRFRGFDQGEKL